MVMEEEAAPALHRMLLPHPNLRKHLKQSPGYLTGTLASFLLNNARIPQDKVEDQLLSDPTK